jgi:hypothetical protein
MYTGQEREGTTAGEMYYYGARYYDPGLGRFISPDPLAGELNFAGIGRIDEYGRHRKQETAAGLVDPKDYVMRNGNNWYVYCGNNPLKYTDPTGLFNWDTLEVEKGDTLIGITNQLNKLAGTNYTYQDIARLNNIEDPNVIHTGQWLAIPDKAYNKIFADKIITEEEKIRNEQITKQKEAEFINDFNEMNEIIVEGSHRAIGLSELAVSAGLFTISIITEQPETFLAGLLLLADSAYQLSANYDMLSKNPTLADELFTPTISTDDYTYFYGNGAGYYIDNDETN